MTTTFRSMQSHRNGPLWFAVGLSVWITLVLLMPARPVLAVWCYGTGGGGTGGVCDEFTSQQNCIERICAFTDNPGMSGTVPDCDPANESCGPAVVSSCSCSCSSTQAACELQRSGPPPSSGDRKLTPRGIGNISLQALAGRFVNLFVGVSGSVALLMFVYGGFLWLTSAGDDQKVTKGRSAMTWAIIGLAIIFGAYAILNALFSALGVGA